MVTGTFLSPPLDALEEVARGFAPISLEETLADAELQTRVDRKYVIAPSQLAVVLASLGDGRRALEIDGLRSFAYESVYFDTPDLDSFRGASTQRRRRWKVRTRTYLDSGTCALEVKTRGERGETIKARLPYDIADRRRLTGSGLAFVTEHVLLPRGGRELEPVLTTHYRRATFVDLGARTRLTVDAGLRCTAVDGTALVLPDHLLVETKSAGAPTLADRALWRAGVRPTAISKFGIGMAGTHDDLAGNRWSRPLRQWYGRDAGGR